MDNPLKYFSELTDPRAERNREHLLEEILLISIAAVLSGALLRKRVGPHTIRHTTATHLLRSGVDINTIRAWLGHVSIDTTNIYAEVDLESKAQMLAQCASLEPVAKRKTHWRDDTSLMAFLRSL
jgi:site-specific recombinase XerD